jgi:hypothetical protein
MPFWLHKKNLPKKKKKKTMMAMEQSMGYHKSQQKPKRAKTIVRLCFN